MTNTILIGAAQQAFLDDITRMTRLAAAFAFIASIAIGKGCWWASKLSASALVWRPASGSNVAQDGPRHHLGPN